MRYQITHEDEKELAGMDVVWKCSNGVKFDGFVVVSRINNACSIKPLDPDKVKHEIEVGNTSPWAYDTHHPKFCFWTSSGKSPSHSNLIETLKNYRGQVLDATFFLGERMGGSGGCRI